MADDKICENDCAIAHICVCNAWKAERFTDPARDNQKSVLDELVSRKLPVVDECRLFAILDSPVADAGDVVALGEFFDWGAVLRLVTDDVVAWIEDGGGW